MSGFLTDVGNFADTVGNKIESGFSNLGRKTVDLSYEEKQELDNYFDSIDSDSGMLVDSSALSEEQEERYSKYSKMGWRREIDEDGNFVYSREKTSKEMQKQLEEAIPAGKRPLERLSFRRNLRVCLACLEEALDTDKSKTLTKYPAT